MESAMARNRDGLDIRTVWGDMADRLFLFGIALRWVYDQSES
jgi:hypothetical protein